MSEKRTLQLHIREVGTDERHPPMVEVWEVREDRFCPTCGKSPVCVEEDRGDYYDDPRWACPACGVRFVYCDDEPANEQSWGARVKALRKALELSTEEGT